LGYTMWDVTLLLDELFLKISRHSFPSECWEPLNPVTQRHMPEDPYSQQNRYNSLKSCNKW